MNTTMNYPQHPHAASTNPPQDDRFLAAFCHAAWFVGMPVIAPLAIYLWKRDSSRFVAFQALQALIWSVLSVIGTTVLLGGGFVLQILLAIALEKTWFGPVIPFLFIGTLMVPWCLFMFFSLIAAVKTFRGEPYSMPIAGRMAERFARDSARAPRA